jgi:hypothetical protein
MGIFPVLQRCLFLSRSDQDDHLPSHSSYISLFRVSNFQLLITFEAENADMGILRQLAEYLYIKKRDPNAPHTQWMKYMHGINRISIFMFLLAMIILIVKLVFFKRS